MAHMVLQSDFFKAYNVRDEGDNWTIVPTDVAGPNPGLAGLSLYTDLPASNFETVEGWFARYSAPGYLDCTEWLGPYSTEAEALDECKAIFGDNYEAYEGD